MSWLSWFVKLLKKLVNEEEDKKILIGTSPNKRAQLFYEVKLHPGALHTFYLINPTDSSGDLELYFDDLPALYHELRRQKLHRSIGVRDSELEKQLAESFSKKRNHRLTVIRTWKVQGQHGRQRTMQELKYVIDFSWGIENHYDRPYNSFKAFAVSLLKEELPSHQSDWGKYLCNSHAIDWAKRLEITANTKDTKVIFPKS
jgi:hypothetical protein